MTLDIGKRLRSEILTSEAALEQAKRVCSGWAGQRMTLSYLSQGTSRRVSWRSLPARRP